VTQNYTNNARRLRVCSLMDKLLLVVNLSKHVYQQLKQYSGVILQLWELRNELQFEVNTAYGGYGTTGL